MGYEIRTLATLGAQARQFFTQAVPGAIASVWANTFTVLGKVFALLDFEHELRRQWLFNQLFASTADEVWLTRHGFELGLTPDTGAAATGTAVVSAKNGLVVPAELQFERADGATFSVLAAVTATGPTVTLTLQADDVGAAYDVDAGATLSLIQSSGAPDGLGDTATVGAAGLAGGEDEEDIESFRARVLYRKRNPPQGGSSSDYVTWAREALGTVLDVFVDSFANDARSVWVCFRVTDQANNMPTGGQVATVQAYVDDSVRRPVTARVFATGPTGVGVPIAIRNLSPDTTDVRGAIMAEIAALQLDEIEPARPNMPFTLYREQLDAAINRATGVGTFTLVSPSADLIFTTGGQMPVLQVPTYS